MAKPGQMGLRGEIDIYRANYLFRAVELEPGLSEVRFVYEPASLRAGLLLSGITLSVLAVGFVWRMRR